MRTNKAGVSKERLRRDLDRLGEEDLRALLVYAVETGGDAIVALVAKQLYKAPADIRRCSICKHRYDANINSSRSLCRKEHEWMEPGELELQWNDCCRLLTRCK